MSETNEAINTFIENVKLDWQVEICRQLDQTVREAIPDAEGRIQYGKPHYLKQGKYAAVFGTAKGWVSFTIFNATALKPPADLFESSDNADRITIKIQKDQTVDYALLGDLVKHAADTIPAKG